MDDRPHREMPRYRSHKEVHALKLREVQHDTATMQLILIPEDKEYAYIVVSAVDSLYSRIGFSFDEGRMERGDPGYLVVYEDGFRSWSPTKAFEDGYTRIE